MSFNKKYQRNLYIVILCLAILNVKIQSIRTRAHVLLKPAQGQCLLTPLSLATAVLETRLVCLSAANYVALDGHCFYLQLRRCKLSYSH